MGRNPRAPWKSQIDVLKIDDRDIISDSGEEIWSVLEQRGIDNVILLGVHTNMCVLGRPFGLRQMAKNGKNVVLMRDLTDTMYNPARAPFVSHFTGTDLIVEHVEKWVCPTITSDQILGGKPFRFSGDKRPHLVIVHGRGRVRDRRALCRSLPRKHLGKDFRVSTVFGSDKERNDLPGIDVLNEADVALISVRRRALPKEQMDSDPQVRGERQAGRRHPHGQSCLLAARPEDRRRAALSGRRSTATCSAATTPTITATARRSRSSWRKGRRSIRSWPGSISPSCAAMARSTRSARWRKRQRRC